MRILPPLVLFAAALLAGCRSAPPEDASALILRTYDVPKGSARSVVAVLDSTFWLGEQQKRLGRASITPDGRLAVLAPSNVHTGVQTLVDEVAKHPPTFDQTIELHYFLVVGKGANAPQPPPPGVAEIQPALDEIVRSQGPQTFTVVQRAHLVTLNGESGKVEADKLKITQKAAQTNDGVDAIVTMDFSGNDKIDSRVHLTEDRIVVLGATGQRSEPGDGTTLYYVVRVAPRGTQK
jgi:hypothetical protein